jgi:hypothetical protein
MEGLQEVLDRLVAAKVIRPPELAERGGYYDDPDNRYRTRRITRIRLNFRMPVIDLNDSDRPCIVRDISETGIRVAGVEADVGDVKAFKIPEHAFTGIEPFGFKATCRWVKQKGMQQKFSVAGFEITAISEESLAQLQKMIHLLSVDTG